MGKVIGGMIGCGCLAVLAVVGFVLWSAGRQAPSGAALSPNVGDIVELRSRSGSGVLACATRDLHGRMTDLAAAKDTRGIAAMVAARQCFLAPDGLLARKLASRVSTCEVRIEAGQHAGEAAWVACEMLAAASPAGLAP